MLNQLIKRFVFLAFCCANGMLFSQSDCDGTDTTPPQMTIAPSIGEGFCGFPQPQATATDNGTGDVHIQAQLSVFSPQTACELFQPDLGANLCNYPMSSSLMLMNLPLVYRHFSIDSGSWNPASDGTAHLSAVFHSGIYPNGGFVVEADFNSGMNWEQWSSFPGRSYKADCEGVAANHTQWLYYILGEATLTGFGEFEGSFYNLSHAPANHIYGYQVGWGANNYSPEYGSGGWFIANGVFIHNGNTISNAQTAGDFMFRHECLEPQPILQYVYTATDACDNSTVQTQNINTCDLQGPLLANMPMAGTVMTPCELEAWQPEWLPNSCEGPFTYTLSYSMGNIENSDDHIVGVSLEANACGLVRSYQFNVVVPDDSELPCLETSCIADVNGDQLVTTSDVMEVIGDFLTENEATDLNQDGVVNIPDLIIVISSFGSMCD